MAAAVSAATATTTTTTTTTKARYRYRQSGPSSRDTQEPTFYLQNKEAPAL